MSVIPAGDKAHFDHQKRQPCNQIPTPLEDEMRRGKVLGKGKRETDLLDWVSTRPMTNYVWCSIKRKITHRHWTDRSPSCN